MINFIRYPGGKGKFISFLSNFLPNSEGIQGTYIEPFVGGGSVFFYLQPKKALLSDINAELIDLYRGIKLNPKRIWQKYRSFPSNKNGYHKIRGLEHGKLNLIERAARSLFLNRTCFKGMWRHNARGEFNIGYGGQSRRWCINCDDLLLASKIMSKASLRCSDFEEVICGAKENDFIFLDPPYRPGEKELLNGHYYGKKFTYEDHRRLASCLRIVNKNNVFWAITTSNHREILKLFKKFFVYEIPKGTGAKIGVLTRGPGEVLISNYRGNNEKISRRSG